MKKALKIIGLSLLGLIIIGAIAMGIFINRVKNGVERFETEQPQLPQLGEKAILVFSKTNAFRHGEAIESSLPIYEQLASKNGWSIFITDNGAVHNPAQLSQFDVIVWNNVSGRVLTDEQRVAFKEYIQQGGGFVGCHATGDFSHKWDWYYSDFIGTSFSHHTMNPHTPDGTIHLEIDSAHLQLSQGLPQTWTTQDEWYVFLGSPRDRGWNVLYTLDEAEIDFNGNIPLLESGKDFGMGADHPIVWYKEIGQGRMLYSAMGHYGSTFQTDVYQQLLQNAINWAGRME
ncbi:MAG: ThuA domain-containing protein [Bacteroidota bacterium]